MSNKQIIKVQVQSEISIYPESRVHFYVITHD
jgi:hypothetical protein